MPLNTQVIRNGEPLEIHWGYFHVAAMVFAASIDSGKGPFPKFKKGHQNMNHNFKLLTGHDYPAEFHSCDAMKQDDNDKQMCANCGHVLPIILAPVIWMRMGYPEIGATPLNHGGYVLKSDYEFLDATDGEVFQLKAGDELVAYRN